MTDDERLDRLERLAKLFARAGVRERRARRELRENINMVINLQIENEDRWAKNEVRWAKNEVRWAKNEDRWARTDERFEVMAQSVSALASAQIQAQQRLDLLIDIIQKDRNGHSA
jgi:hypothetical protein